jgi:hypothetical protein
MLTIARVAFAVAAGWLLASPSQAQTLGSPRLTPGWATFAVQLPRGGASGGLALGDVPTQTDVKVRWPDGSIRMAVVTAQVQTAATYPLVAGPARTGTSTITPPTAEVDFAIDGRTYVARVPPPSADVWLDGPLVREWRSVVAPAGPSGPHPFLRVVFDTRVYNDGRMRLDATVENLLDVAGAASVRYDVNILVDGRTVFSKANVTHPWLTRWRRIVGSPDLALATVTPDLEPAIAAGAVPRYLSTVKNVVQKPEGPAFDILGVGALNTSMPDAGGRAEIAPYPDWAARYLVHRDPTQRAFVLAQGDLAGSWPIHLRESDGRLVSIDERPNFWLDGRCERDGKSCPRGTLAANTLVPDKAHQPSLAYIPYLLTGDRYYADEMAFWANYELLATWPTERQGARGLINYYEIRGFAWTMRNLGDAAAYLPDSYPAKRSFVAKLSTNLQWADDYTAGKITTGRVGQALHPLGISFYYADGADLRVAEWENYYLAWSLDHIAGHGFSGGLKLRDRIARLALRGYTSEPEFPRRCAFYYRPVVGRAPGMFSTSMGEFAQQGACQDTRDLADGYWGLWQRPTLMIALREQWPGAADAYAYMMSYRSSSGTVLDRANESAGWALASGTDFDKPAPPPPPPPSERRAPERSSSLPDAPTITLPPIIRPAPVVTRNAEPDVSPDGTRTIRFDDLPWNNQALAGQYPAGVINWPRTQWYVSRPVGALTTNSVSFDGGLHPEARQAVFTLLVPQTVAQIDAYNGGDRRATVTIACGKLRSTTVVAAQAVVTIKTGWTAACTGDVTLGSSNGWDTNFDNIVIVRPRDVPPSRTSATPRE